MDFITIYFTDTFDTNSIDLGILGELFNVEVVLGAGSYINVYTIDRSIVDSIAEDLGRSNIIEIAYP